MKGTGGGGDLAGLEPEHGHWSTAGRFAGYGRSIEAHRGDSGKMPERHPGRKPTRCLLDRRLGFGRRVLAGDVAEGERRAEGAAGRPVCLAGRRGDAVARAVGPRDRSVAGGAADRPDLIDPLLPKPTRAEAEADSSGVEDGQVEPAEAGGVGDRVDGDNLPADDREVKDH